MSCVVGMVDKKKKTMVFAGDSALAHGIYDVQLRRAQKTFVNGKAIVGVCGSPRDLQLIQHGVDYSIPHEVMTGGRDVIERFLTMDFVERIRKCLKSNGALTTDDGQESMDSEMMIGIAGSIFRIGAWFAVEQSQFDFDSIGCGSTYAKGALYVLHVSSIDMETKLVSALMAAAEFSAYVRQPFGLTELSYKK